MSIQDEELQLLLHDMIDRYGYDFTGYSEASLKRRITYFMIRDHVQDISRLRSLIANVDYFRLLVEA
ncbi:MAG TPA: protein-glutamate O-methyltransferase CheR, partial [Puia sp.]|nr:protein-glutamate O-methyltransferase CheR [Puia sp.]